MTLDELNAVMPSDEVTSDQIEDVYATLSDMGINVVENERAKIKPTTTATLNWPRKRKVAN